MNNRRFFVVCLVALLVLGLVPAAEGRLKEDRPKDRITPKALANPAYALMAHRVGRMELGITNNGAFGKEYARGATSDYFTGGEVPSCEFPKGSNVEYLFGATFWIGAVVGRDTLVSVGADGWQVGTVNEFSPDAEPFGNPVYRSIIDPNSPYFEGAVSEEDYICVYADTLTEGIEPDFFGRTHRPLNIEITEASYAWSYSYAEDIVLFDYQVKNIGGQTLRDVYMGLYVDADIAYSGASTDGAQDDLSGFRLTNPDTCGACVYPDTVFIAWVADNDGDLTTENPASDNSRAVRHVNPWDYPVKVHTYEEYEDEFRDVMRAAGLPLDKEGKDV